MTKGTFIAGQALRPTELKVADYYGKYIDDMIKRGDAKKAAQAKALQEEKNRIGERFKDIKIDPYATIANLQDFANQQMVETAKYIGTQRVLAENDLANSHVYMQRAENAWNDYRTMSSSFGNKDFIEKANAKQQALANNDVFGDTDNNERLRMLGTIIPNVKRNEDGRITFYMPQNANATDDDELQAYSAGQIISHWTTPDEINMLRSNKSNGNNGFLDKQSYELAKTMADEYSKNYDGNITNGKTWFSETRGNQWFDSTFGQYNPNNVPTIVSQYSKAILGKEINSPEDFAAAKQGIINHVASLVPETIKRDTDKMGVEVAILNERLKGEKLDNAQKAYNLANPGSYSRGGGSTRGSGAMSNGSTAGMSYSSANQNVFVQTKVNTNGKTKTVVKQQPMRILTLPKLKGQPSTNNVFGVTKYRNKQGTIVDAYYVGVPAEDGRIVTSRVDGKELDSYFVKLGYNPMVAKQYLFEQTNDPNNTGVPYIGKQTGEWQNIPQYTKPILFKVNTSKTEDDDQSL